MRNEKPETTETVEDEPISIFEESHGVKSFRRMSAGVIFAFCLALCIVKEIQSIRVQLAEIKGRLENMPSSEFVAQSIIHSESRIEKRLDEVSKQIETLTAVLLKGKTA